MVAVTDAVADSDPLVAVIVCAPGSAGVQTVPEHDPSGEIASAVVELRSATPAPSAFTPTVCSDSDVPAVIVLVPGYSIR
jgi:hypothetical protein